MRSGPVFAAWIDFQVPGQSRAPNFRWPANTVGRPQVLSQKQPWPQLCHLWREARAQSDDVHPAMKEAGAPPFEGFRSPSHVDRRPWRHGLLLAIGWLSLAWSRVG